MTKIPPPPGSEVIPPPSPEGDAFENDVLKRRTRFSWKKFGGEGFLVSVAFHILLLVAGLFWFIGAWKEPAKKPGSPFDIPGGSRRGEGIKPVDHAVKTPRPMLVRAPSVIVAKGANASVALPANPAARPASFAGNLSGGEISKGSGGLGGGGSGPGTGPGKGRGYLGALFGVPGLNAPGLPGFFYDAKQTADGKPTKYEPTSASAEFADQVLRPLIKSWDPSRYDGRFFKAPDQLNASQIFIPAGPAEGAPNAYGVGEKVKPSRWFAWYRGSVTAPKSGKFRFWGLGDDTLVVRWDKRLALDAGWSILSQGKGEANHGAFTGKPVLGVTETKKGRPGALFRAGPWFDVVKGREYPIEIIISEIPGGSSSSWLMMEEADAAGKPEGGIFLFRMSSEPLPPGIRQDTGLEIDMTGKDLFWTARGAAKPLGAPVR